MMQQSIALFDFDGTLYKKDSLLEFTRFSFGNVRFLSGMAVLSPFLLGMKFGIFKNSDVKRRYFTHFFSGMSYEEFCRKAVGFATAKIDLAINPILLNKFKMHIEGRHEVYIVTASMAEWIKPWSDRYGVSVIGTSPEIADGHLTGKFSSENCYGAEKVNRILKLIKLEAYGSVYVYGRGKGDLEMLKLRRNCQAFS